MSIGLNTAVGRNDRYFGASETFWKGRASVNYEPLLPERWGKAISYHS
jgi:hypothetical protein